MIASLQRATSLLLVAAVLGWLAWSRTEPWAIQLLGTLILLASHSVALAAQFALLTWIHGDDPAPRASILLRLQAWLQESIVAARVFLWEQPWQVTRHPDQLADGAASDPPPGVVLIHGFICNRGLWNPWMKRLTADGRSFVAVNLEPVFGSIDEYVPIVDDAVRRVTAATGRPPVLVCHSMGGLAARAWLRATNADARVARVFTLGSPHHGTWLARWGHGRNGRQMQLDSTWLQSLAVNEAAERRARFTCYYSNCDNIVMPTSSAALPGAENRFIAGVPHLALARDAAIMEQVLGWTPPPRAS